MCTLWLSWNFRRTCAELCLVVLSMDLRTRSRPYLVVGGTRWNRENAPGPPPTPISPPAPLPHVHTSTNIHAHAQTYVRKRASSTNNRTSINGPRGWAAPAPPKSFCDSLARTELENGSAQWMWPSPGDRKRTMARRPSSPFRGVACGDA